MLPQGAGMTLDKQVTAKLAFEPGDKKKLEEIWLTVEKTILAWAESAHPPCDTTELNYCRARAREFFDQAYLQHGINGPLATKALAAVGL